MESHAEGACNLSLSSRRYLLVLSTLPSLLLSSSFLCLSSEAKVSLTGGFRLTEVIVLVHVLVLYPALATVIAPPRPLPTTAPTSTRGHQRTLEPTTIAFFSSPSCRSSTMAMLVDDDVKLQAPTMAPPSLNLSQSPLPPPRTNRLTSFPPPGWSTSLDRSFLSSQN